MLSFVAPTRCAVCAQPSPRLPFCSDCQAGADRLWLPADTAVPSPAGIRRVVGAYRYTGPVARAVVAGKVLGATGVWRPFGRDLARAARDAGVTGDVVVPVPTDRRRRRRRGIDHAAVLAVEVARAIRVPMRAALAVRTGLPDRGAGEPEGSVLPADAVRVRLDVHDRSVVLVDDVVTTGVTAAASAAALLAAGVTDVQLLVLACASLRPTGS